MKSHKEKSVNELSVGFVTWEKASNRPFNSCGSSRIRARWVAKYWKNAEEWQVGKDYDVLIFQKSYWDLMIDNFKGIKILDECDATWLERHDVVKYYEKCDAITTSTQPLAEYIRKLLPHKIVRYIPDRVDLEGHRPIKGGHKETLKSLVWFGYSQNLKYLIPVFNTLIREGLSLTIYSDTGMTLGANHKKLDLTCKTYNYPTLHRDLIKYDAAIFNADRKHMGLKGRYKSNNKLTTCWALGIPVITCPEDIKRLSSLEARKKEAEKKLALVRKKYDVRQSVEEYKALIEDIRK